MNVLRNILKASDMQIFCCEESSGQMTKVLPPWPLPTDWPWHSSGFVPSQNYPPPFSAVRPITQYHSLLKTWVLWFPSRPLFLACRQPPPVCYVITFFYEFKVLYIKCLYKVDSRVLYDSHYRHPGLFSVGVLLMSLPLPLRPSALFALRPHA